MPPRIAAHFRAPLPARQPARCACRQLPLRVPIPRNRFDAWLADWPAIAGPGLLRMKACSTIEGEVAPQIVHGVQHTLHPPESLPVGQTA
jgi:G3E family GTPase